MKSMGIRIHDPIVQIHAIHPAGTTRYDWSTPNGSGSIYGDSPIIEDEYMGAESWGEEHLDHS